MARNRRRGLLYTALFWASIGITLGQESTITAETAESSPTPVVETPPIVPVDPTPELLKNLALDQHAQTQALSTRFSQLESQLQTASEKGRWTPLISLCLLLLTPIALFLLGRLLMQRLASQSDELKRQRLGLEALDESLRDLPGNLPRPALDTTKLADRLRNELKTPSPAPAAPTPAVTPFYQNSQWLGLAVEGPRRYLDFLAETRETLNTEHRELTDSENPGEALALVGWILARFYDRQANCPAGRWHQLLRVAEETGYVTEPQLAQRLTKARGDEEAARTLHRALYREVLEQSISDHLILLEEMRHLPNFCGAEASYAACQSISQRIEPLVETFLTQTRRLAGYTPNHVPLFSDFTEEAAQFLRNNASEKLPRIYQSLNLPRRQVLCVLAYGLRRERGWENEETQVILS